MTKLLKTTGCKFFILAALAAIPTLALAFPGGPGGPGPGGFPGGPGGPWHGPGFPGGFGQHDPNMPLQQLQAQYDQLADDYNNLMASYNSLQESYNQQSTTISSLESQVSSLQAEVNACQQAPVTPTPPSAAENVCTLTGTDGSGNTLSGQGLSMQSSDPSASQAKSQAIQNCLNNSNQNAACSNPVYIQINCTVQN